MLLAGFIQEMLETESLFGQTVRWQPDTRALYAVSEKRMGILTELSQRCERRAEYPCDDLVMDEHFKMRLNEIAECDADQVLRAWRLEILVNQLNVGLVASQCAAE